MNVTAISGGVGAAKLLVGFGRALGGPGLTAVVNTADDEVIYGVHVSPDVDIVTYWLAGIADTQRGWGIAGDTFNVVEGLRELGDEAWFNLGDRDFATCLLRTLMLSSGATLSDATAHVARALGLIPAVLPMTDDRVRTRVECADGRTLAFQEYFVRERCAPEVTGVAFEGAESARPAPGVLDAISGADVLVICPSNPLVSTAPVLAVPGVRDAVAAHPFVVAISPIVGGSALKGPADRMLVSTGHDSSAAAVARLYADLCDHFVVDQRDAGEVEAVEALGMSCTAVDTVMTDGTASEKLARYVLGLR
ncbi:MAG TPA: 2-phospho-L-lactate transferase [Actinomycetota bacterium]|nr:2-phospho-L-lactate transferase [Actinomycetota bacterium]